MPEKQDDAPVQDSEIQVRQQHGAMIGDHVLRGLGHPVGLYRMQVRWLWDGNYRVNVHVGADVSSARVAHSYFVAADAGGKVLSTVPEIVREYEPLTTATPPSKGSSPFLSVAS